MTKKLSKRNKTFKLKTTIVKALIISGNKRIVEKIVLKSVKFQQKSTYKNCRSLMHFIIISSAPIIKLSQYNFKKGKKIVIKTIPLFLENSFFRIKQSLKLMKYFTNINKRLKFIYKYFALSTLQLKLLNTKNELVKQEQVKMQFSFKKR